MSIPRDKTWQKVEIANPAGTGPTAQSGTNELWDREHRQLWWEFKEAITSVAQGAWTLEQSCGYDSGSWTFGASDNWTVSNDVRYKEDAGDEFSWAVFRQNALKTNAQMLVALENNYNQTEYGQSIYFSPSGSFTGGNATTRPSAPDEHYIRCVGNYWTASSSNKGFVLFMSTDGECLRVVNTVSGAPRYIWCAEKLKNQAPNTVLTGEFIAGFIYCQNNDEMINWNVAGESQRTAQVYGIGSQIIGAVPRLADSFGHNTVLRGPNPSGEYPAAEITVCAFGPGRGILGKMYDCFKVSNALADGDYAPVGGSREHVVVKGYLLGNDGTDVVFT